MTLVNVFGKAYQGYDDTDDGCYAEESRLEWVYITASSILVWYSYNNSFVIFSPSKRAGYIARVQFHRKTKRKGFNLKPKIIIGREPDKSIRSHPAYRNNMR